MLETLGMTVQLGSPGENGFYHVDHDIYLFDVQGKLLLRSGKRTHHLL